MNITKIPYKIPNILTSPDLDRVSLDGEIGARFDRFVYERITGGFALEYIWREAEEVFADKYDDEYAAGMWRSEFWGKLVLSAVRVCRMNGSAALREQIRASAYRMLSYQTDAGDISTYRDSADVFAPSKEAAIRDMGWECTYNWNIWGQKYTLWAMLECAELLDDIHIVGCCRRIADNLIATLKRLGKRLKDTGTSLMVGMPPCSIMKPMLVLYRMTGRREYLDFCIETADEWRRDDNEMPNLINNALTDTAPSKWYDGWYAKAYEMLSCYDGLCELYRVTGDAVYFGAVKGIWELLNKYELNILGSVGYCERFADGASQFDSATEICDAIHWMRLSFELFMLTGEAKYMEAFERAYLNAFLAGIYEDGKTGAFFVRAAGRHWTAEPQVETKYQHCCVNNAARAFVNAAEAAVTYDGSGYYINMYAPVRVRIGETSLRVSSGYADNGMVNVIVRGIAPGKKLYFRIPEWSRNTVIKCGDTEIKPDCGSYAEVTAESEEFNLKLRFDMTPRFYDYGGEFVDYAPTDYHRMRWCDSRDGLCGREQMLYAPKSVLYRGPVLLARTKRLGASEDEMFGEYTVYGREKSASAQVIRHDRMLCACRVKVECDGEVREYVMCDFASAADRDLEDVRFFSVYM